METEQSASEAKDSTTGTELESKPPSPIPIDRKKNDEDLDFDRAFIKSYHRSFCERKSEVVPNESDRSEKKEERKFDLTKRRLW